MKLKKKKKDQDHSGVSRRDLLKGVAGITLFTGSGSLSLVRSIFAEDAPPEPDNLDEPTQWQEGDPEPVEATVPAQEPEQTSAEAPPSQPMDDERSAQPAPNYVWASGYWWWTGGQYVWVPGYWVVPPEPEYIYVPGYWTYRGTTWVYVRGGWGRPNTTVVVVYPKPRPVLTAFIITAPIRIARRNRRWRHYPSRRRRHRAAPRRSPGRGPSGPGRGPSGPGGPGSGPGGPGTSKKSAPRRR